MIQIKESYVNRTENYRAGDSDWYEAYTDDLGKLFKSLRKEYGKCTNKVYQDNYMDGSYWHCGWVFQKRMKYDRSNKTFLSETWITFKYVAD